MNIQSDLATLEFAQEQKVLLEEYILMSVQSVSSECLFLHLVNWRLILFSLGVKSGYCSHIRIITCFDENERKMIMTWNPG